MILVILFTLGHKKSYGLQTLRVPNALYESVEAEHSLYTTEISEVQIITH